ncbi:MAG: UvrD-helicase domain-containing protein, partial [Trebonia sp.]
MARLAIAKTFLTEYGRLDKDVQIAVDAAIAKFAKHPNPGIHLEKPQRSWDDRIRTLEVDSRWHGIVLAPTTGDTYCLVTILPPNKAKAYATSRRFSVNPALGVLEVRDEEAIQQLQPPPEDDSEPDDKRLFADLSDAALTWLGIDEQILPTIRLLTGEADLETRQEAFPEAQYAALHALADGMTLDEAREEVTRLYYTGTPPEKVDPDDLVSAMERTPGQVTFVSGPEELRRIFAHPFAAWRMFLHPSQRTIAHRTSYAGPAQVTGGPGTGKTVTLLHRAAFLAARAVIPGASKPGAQDQPHWREPGAGQVLVTSFNGTLADALSNQLDLLIQDDSVRRRIEVLNVDRLAYGIVKAARGAPVIADEQLLRTRWAEAAAATKIDLSPAFLKNEWEQVILAQDLHGERAYLTCLRAGRGRPLTRSQRSQVWHAAQRVTSELAAARLSTHLQLANEATHLLRQAGGTPRYRHILVDEAQDLHPSQWRLLRAAVPPGPDDLFIAADPHQRIYDNRVSLTSMRISVRGRTRRLSLNYRTTEEILTWAIPLIGTDQVTGLDGEVDSLLGYQSPMHGPRPRLRVAATREEEFAQLAEQIRSWLAVGIEPQAIGLTARSAGLVREAREMLMTEGIMSTPLSGRGSAHAIRAGTMHALKGLEFQAVAVIGVEQGLVPKPEAITLEGEDPVAYANDLQRERCVLFVACTRARDHLYVSGTGTLSTFLPHCGPVPAVSGADSDGPDDPEESLSPARDPRRKVSTRELLWLREDSWRPRLRSASLVVEADLRP